ncbi:Phosphate butyryltransferase [Mucinivorans hirudinis]|uniref:Phosphate butyryltransferase n=1 Tax=Mucinivorans hirudinis TaxID=1433126 RepID=A0A060RCU7_9BACT|nr:Phosphate butyryltransferase [Mucinivorans hirudinis]
MDAILIGNRKNIAKVAAEEGIDLADFIIQEEADDVACVNRAVKMINAGEADILMKGLVSTDKYMRGILQKDGGLVPAKATLSHITVLELPMYHKLLIVTDVAVLPAPDLSQKIQLTKNVISCANTLGIKNPKIALITPTEQMLPGIPSCVDAAIISKMAERGQIPGAIIDGPLALDVAIDPETVKIKKLHSPVGGDADGLVFPNLEAANVFFKSATKLCGAKLAAIVVGAKAPCVLTSRGDSEESKLYSIALASLSAK